MRVLMLSEFYGRTGGVNTHMTELSRFLRHEVILSNTIESMNVRPDIVHIHHAFTPLTFKALKLAKKRGIPAIVTNHSIAPLHDSYFWKLLKLGFKYLNDASAIIAVSDEAKRFISNFTSKDVVVIPNGVDVEKFRPMKGNGQSKALLYVGRLSARKGVQLLTPLLFKCLKEYDAELIIAGKDEMFMLPLLKLQGSLCKKVRVLGFIPDANLPELYNHADLFLMPSLTMESFGITAIESLACATPVVATRAGALPKIIKSGGVATNLWEFPKVIANLLSNPDRIRQLGNEGRKFVEEEYSWNVVAKRIEDVYSKVLDGEFHEERNT
ncbi:MAG: glycosyltransferase family 4 protein [Archaeoglobus sp.]|uniref:glycosyltransferase family 4 protein n=1 Tax=Archaeoglobus sp. TaxID=1872626 RepID=UPI001D5654BF|nr:glycosyltransferase family 4 protein [Archaeoglobus sp.]MBO8181093.1 glycosyltransferase family 4 protein [Archaeoglobus sp.]